MKKTVSLVLTFVMLFQLFTIYATPVLGAEEATTRSTVPTILIAGDGDPIYDADNNRLFRPSEILKFLSRDDGEDEDSSELYESIANILMPFLIDGILYDEWDEYYKNLQKELSELFEEIILDNNGNVTNGTGISNTRKKYMENCIKTDKADKNGTYDLYDYRFWYDWRLDPIAIADDFHNYIEAVKAVTKKDKVAVVGRCLGTSVVMAYIAKYGTDSLQGVSLYGSVAAGAELLSEPISGKFNIDGNAITRTMTDYGDMLKIHPLITSTVDLLTKSGILDTFTESAKLLIYYKLVEGVTSALALSTFYTWPNYWAAVSPEDYDDALLYVFGAEGSEKRTEYAGLIEKIENYNSLVRDNLTELMKSLGEKGVNVGILSKYGFQLLPIVQSADAVADEFTSVKRSSFGATASTIYTTLTEEQISAGGKYVSPDKRVDASTCIYPDSTWFVKGSSHTLWNRYEDEIMHLVATADTQLTVDDFEYSQYMVYDEEADTMVKMTEENCNTENWVADDDLDNPKGLVERFLAILHSLMKWFTNLFELITEKLSK